MQMFVTSTKSKEENMSNTPISEEKLSQIYNFLNNLGHLKVLDVDKAKRLANELESYVHNS